MHNGHWNSPFKFPINELTVRYYVCQMGSMPLWADATLVTVPTKILGRLAECIAAKEEPLPVQQEDIATPVHACSPCQ